MLEETPHIFFAGNQPEYASRLVQGTLQSKHGLIYAGKSGQKVRIISIPKFSKTGEIVLVNLSTLESEVVKFSAGKMTREEDTEDTAEPKEKDMDDIEEL